MAASDQLAKLSARAKEAETRVAAAEDKAKADLEKDISYSRAAGQQQAQALREMAEDSERKISNWWNDVQEAWDKHVAAFRESIDERKAERDLSTAETRADYAEDDALFAIDFAYSAIQEAEYAALDASLARMEADELKTSSGATA